MEKINTGCFKGREKRKILWENKDVSFLEKNLATIQ